MTKVDTPSDDSRILAGPGTHSLTNFPVTDGSRISPFETVRLKPGDSETFYFNGATGATVQMTLERVPNSGGHHHGGATTDPLAVGTVTPASLTLTGAYPQNARCVFTAPDVCGQVTFLGKHSDGSVDEYLLEIMFDSFLPIPQSTGIALKAPDRIHPSPYWADPAFISKLRQLGERYYGKTTKNITITDASLPWGGRFDIEAEPKPPKPSKRWKAPHAEHRNGRQADVRLFDMSEDDKEAFKTICADLGITAEIHNDNHWHIRLPTPPSSDEVRV